MLLLGRERIPRWQAVRTRRELGVGRNNAQLLLPLKCILADRIPALIELAFVLLDPLLVHMMRRVRRTCGVVDEEGLVLGDGVVLMQPLDGVIGDVCGEVIALLRRLAGSTGVVSLKIRG